MFPGNDAILKQIFQSSSMNSIETPCSHPRRSSLSVEDRYFEVPSSLLVLKYVEYR